MTGYEMMSLLKIALGIEGEERGKGEGGRGKKAKKEKGRGRAGTGRPREGDGTRFGGRPFPGFRRFANIFLDNTDFFLIIRGREAEAGTKRSEGTADRRKQRGKRPRRPAIPGERRPIGRRRPLFRQTGGRPRRDG